MIKVTYIIYNNDQSNIFLFHILYALLMSILLL